MYDLDIPINSSQGQKSFAILANELLNKENPAEHNQAIMEFGALQCTPKNPNCETCPFVQLCLARKNDTILNRPVKTSKTKIRSRYFHFLHIENETHILITKRTQKDIWQNMYQLPLIEKVKEINLNEIKSELKEIYNIEVQLEKTNIKHILSHQHLHTTFWRMKTLPKILENKEEFQWILKKELDKFPIPRVIERYLEGIEG